MYQNGIFSRNDFNYRINKDHKCYERAKAELERLEKQIASVQKIYDDCAVFSAINKKIPNVTEEDRQEYRRTAYCRQYDADSIEKQFSELMQKQISVTANYESAKQQLSHSEKNLSQYDLYMPDDYSKIVEQVLAERQVVAEAEQQRLEIHQDRSINLDYHER